jgi:hypothetical protein
MEVKNYQLGDEIEIVKLFELVFKEPMSLAQWNWRFRDNPAGKYMIKLMWEEEQLIGHYALSPVYLNVSNERILSAHSLTTMTHPEYGGRGIFKTLANDLYDYVERERGVKAIWGFPNNNSHYGFVKNLEWKDIGVLHTLVCPSSRLARTSTDLEVREVSKFEHDHVELFARDTGSFSVSVERSVEYLNWRYVTKPSTQYRIFELIENTVLTGVMVTKVYPQRNEVAVLDLNITDLALADYTNLHSFLAKVITQQEEEFRNVTVWKNLFDPNHKKFERIGFVPGLPLTYLGIRTIIEWQKQLGELKNWYYSQGDSDVY